MANRIQNRKVRRVNNVISKPPDEDMIITKILPPMDIMFVVGDLNIRNNYMKNINLHLLKQVFSNIKNTSIKSILFFGNNGFTADTPVKEIDLYFRYLKIISGAGIISPETGMNIIKAHVSNIKTILNADIEAYINSPHGGDPKFPLYIIEVNPMSLFDILCIDKNYYSDFYNAIAYEMNMLNLNILYTIICKYKETDESLIDNVVDNRKWTLGENNFYKYYERYFGDVYTFNSETIDFQKIADKKRTFSIYPKIKETNKFLICVDGFIGSNKKDYMIKIGTGYANTNSRIVFMPKPDTALIDDCDFEANEKTMIKTDFILEIFKQRILEENSDSENIIFIIEGSFFYRRWFYKNISERTDGKKNLIEAIPKIDTSILDFVRENKISYINTYSIKSTLDVSKFKRSTNILSYVDYVKKYDILYNAYVDWYYNKNVYIE